MKTAATLIVLLALSACAEGPSQSKSALGLSSQQNITASQRAQIRAVLNNDGTTLSQRRRIRAILSR